MFRMYSIMLDCYVVFSGVKMKQMLVEGLADNQATANLWDLVKLYTVKKIIFVWFLYWMYRQKRTTSVNNKKILVIYCLQQWTWSVHCVFNCNLSTWKYNSCISLWWKSELLIQISTKLLWGFNLVTYLYCDIIKAK